MFNCFTKYRTIFSSTNLLTVMDQKIFFQYSFRNEEKKREVFVCNYCNWGRHEETASALFYENKLKGFHLIKKKPNQNKSKAMPSFKRLEMQCLRTALPIISWERPMFSENMLPASTQAASPANSLQPARSAFLCGAKEQRSRQQQLEERRWDMKQQRQQRLRGKDNLGGAFCFNQKHNLINF